MKTSVFRYLISIAFSFLIGLFLAACDEAGNIESDETPTIIYTVSGGFWGGISTKLSVNPAGIAKLEHTYPPIIYQLSQQEYIVLLSYFDQFNKLRESYPNQCTDGSIFTIERQGTDYSKQVEIDACTLNSNSSVSKIKSIISVLEALANKIYLNEAPWRGLVADFSIDSDIYNSGEPITMRYRISNPTAKERTLYFRHQSRYWFLLEKYNFPSFYYYPHLPYNDTSAGSEIHFDPGETKDVIYVLNQPLSYPSGDTAMGVGQYSLFVNLLAGDFAGEFAAFEVLDRDIPVSGVIIPDQNGLSSQSYTFTLSVRNWTTGPVTLNFPSSQSIHVEVFGSNEPVAENLIYSGPIVSDSLSWSVTLLPGELREFKYTAEKRFFVSWYRGTYVRVRLLATDFDLVSDAQLRILQ